MNNDGCSKKDRLRQLSDQLTELVDELDDIREDLGDIQSEMKADVNYADCSDDEKKMNRIREALDIAFTELNSALDDMESMG